MLENWSTKAYAEVIGGILILLVGVVLLRNAWTSFTLEGDIEELLVQYDERDIQGAAPGLQDIEGQDGNFPTTAFLRGILDVDRERYGSATEHFEQITEWNEGRMGTAGTLSRGITLMRRFDNTDNTTYLDRAEEAVQNALNTGHINASARAELGNIKFRRAAAAEEQEQKETFLEEARGHFDRTRSEAAGNDVLYSSAVYDLYMGEALTYALSGQHEQAEWSFRSLNSLEPLNPEPAILAAESIARFTRSDAIQNVDNLPDVLDQKHNYLYEIRSHFLEGSGSVNVSPDQNDALRQAIEQAQIGLALTAYEQNLENAGEHFERARNWLIEDESAYPRLMFRRQFSNILRDTLQKYRNAVEQFQSDGEERDREQIIETFKTVSTEISDLLERRRNFRTDIEALVLNTGGLAEFHLYRLLEGEEALEALSYARQDLAEAHDLLPENPTILRNRALVEGISGENPAEAEELASQYFDMTDGDEAFREWFEERRQHWKSE